MFVISNYVLLTLQWLILLQPSTANLVIRTAFAHLRSLSEPAGRQVRGLLLWQQERRDSTCERQSWALTWRDTRDLVESSAHRSGGVKASERTEMHKHTQKNSRAAQSGKGYWAADWWHVWCGGSVFLGERLPEQDRRPSAAPTAPGATFPRSSAHSQTCLQLPTPPGRREREGHMKTRRKQS